MHATTPYYIASREDDMLKKLNLILAVLSAASFGFFIGFSFPPHLAPQLGCYVFPYWSVGGADEANSTFSVINVLAGSNKTAGQGTASTTPVLQPNATSEATAAAGPPAAPKGAERLPPNIVVSESDLHMRRLWGNPREDTPARKYLLTMTVGYNEKANVNATVHKFSDNFDVMLFHYDGKTTEWDADFAWSKDAIHVSARKQAKWWYAKRFLHPSIVAPYDYVFLWDEDLDTTFFDADEYLRIVKKHGLEISQPGLDATRGKTSYEVLIRRSNNSAGEVHRNIIGGPGNCSDVHQRPCSGFVEVMAPVFTRDAWACVWHMVQNDLVHGWGLDYNFWRCVEEPEERIGVVDAQYVAHRAKPTLSRQGNPETGGDGNVRGRAWHEFGDFNRRIRDADRAQQAALLLLAPPPRPK